jgi:hypothetical protein
MVSDYNVFLFCQGRPNINYDHHDHRQERFTVGGEKCLLFGSDGRGHMYITMLEKKKSRMERGYMFIFFFRLEKFSNLSGLLDQEISYVAFHSF